MRLRFYIPVYIAKNPLLRYTQCGFDNFCQKSTKTQYVVFLKKVSHFILRFFALRP